MSTNEIVKNIAREQAKMTLAQSPGFLDMSDDDKRETYLNVYKKNYQQLMQNGSAQAPGSSIAQAMGTKGASRDIDEARHENKRIEQAGELAGEFIDEVDFPGFVRDLLEGVFDANLNVTLKQMESYQKLLKTATQSVSKFVNAIDDTAAFGYLAENNSDEFNIDFSDTEKEEDGSPKAVLTDSSGEPKDIGDNEVKARIMEAKIAMAKEQRALLRETILMGITRLVVEKGQVKASVLFDIKASEKIEKADKAARKESISKSGSLSAGGGLFGKIFGGPSGGTTTSKRKTKISVSSAKSLASTDLAAKVAGSVDIQFKSDYFKLDNFAKMYGPVTEAEKAEVAQAAPAK